MPRSPAWKWIRRIWLASALSFTAWLVWNAQAHGIDPAIRQSGASVVVRDSGSILKFIPRNDTASVGLIFLPGGAIDPWAYAPLLHQVAESGYAAMLVRLPWRVAPTAASQAKVWQAISAVMERQPGRGWVLSGHSRGAALAARFTGEHPDAFAALVLLGTTHPKERNLAALTLPVTKVYGTRDCVADSSSVMANARRLPAATEWIRIDGANHRQFGSYGAQLGDCDATITRSEHRRGRLLCSRGRLPPFMRHGRPWADWPMAMPLAKPTPCGFSW